MMQFIPFFTLIFLIILYWRIRWKKLKTYKSKILGLVEVWEKYNGEKVLTINKYTHGISINKGDITKSYWFFIAKETLRLVNKKKNPQILFLGLGANTSSSIIHKYNPDITQTIIEIDSNIIEACKKYFNLQNISNMTLIQGDAYNLIDKREDFINKFDVIIVDIFTGTPPFVSTTTNKPTYIKKLQRWCKKDGSIIFNRPANIEKDRADTIYLAKYLITLFEEVKSTLVKDPRGYINDIVTASELKNSTGLKK